MYMPNAKTQCKGPNATYIPLAGVGVLHRDKRKFNFFVFFQILYVGILVLGDAKVLSFALVDAKCPTQAVLRSGGI